MNEKQLTDLLILHLAKKMIEKMEKTKNGFFFFYQIIQFTIHKQIKEIKNIKRIYYTCTCTEPYEPLQKS